MSNFLLDKEMVHFHLSWIVSIRIINNKIAFKFEVSYTLAGILFFLRFLSFTTPPAKQGPSSSWSYCFAKPASYRAGSAYPSPLPNEVTLPSEAAPYTYMLLSPITNKIYIYIYFYVFNIYILKTSFARPPPARI